MRARRHHHRGSALAEYLAITTGVGILLLALLVLRPHQPSRRPPIDPVGHLGRVLSPPVPRPPRAVRPPAVRPGPQTRPRPRPVRPPRPTVMTPSWAVGW